MYSSEYTSGFSGPAASHPAAPPSPRHEGNAAQAPSVSAPLACPICPLGGREMPDWRTSSARWM